MDEFYRILRLPPYVFEEVNKAKARARNAGADIIDLGMGNPDLPAPAHVIEKLKDLWVNRAPIAIRPHAAFPACGRHRRHITIAASG